MMSKFFLLSITTALAEEDHVSLLQTAALKKHVQVEEAESGDVFRAACENPGHPTFRSCTQGRTGTCYGKVQLRNGGRASGWKDVSGQFSCTNGFFGGDPAPGVGKECVCDGSASPPEGPYVHRVACEHVGHGTYRDCTMGRTGTCYGKVRYGHAPSGRLTGWKVVSGQFSCTTGFFGMGDPAPWQAKECICDGTDTPPPPPEGQFRAACEHVGHGTYRDCTLQRNAACYGKVKYGHGPTNRWTAWKDVMGSFSCTTGFFGSDPAPWQGKECICDGEPTAPEGPYEHRIACEHRSHPTYRDCALERNANCFGKVKYGHAPSNRWTGWKEVNGPVTCDNGLFGFDPARGVGKECICDGTDTPPCPSEFRVACEHVGHPTYRDCRSARTGVCYGKVKYGHGPSNRWTGWKSVSGSFSCTTGFFGSDPAPWQGKECVCEGCDEATTTTTAAPTTTPAPTTEAPAPPPPPPATTVAPTPPPATTTRPEKEYCDLCAVHGGTLNLDGDKKCKKWGSYTPGSSKCAKFQKKKGVAKKCCGIVKVKPTKAPKVDCNVCAAGTFNPDGLDGKCVNHLKAQGEKCTQKQQDERIQARCCV